MGLRETPGQPEVGVVKFPGAWMVPQHYSSFLPGQLVPPNPGLNLKGKRGAFFPGVKETDPSPALCNIPVAKITSVLADFLVKIAFCNQVFEKRGKK